MASPRLSTVRPGVLVPESDAARRFLQRNPFSSDIDAIAKRLGFEKTGEFYDSYDGQPDPDDPEVSHIIQWEKKARIRGRRVRIEKVTGKSTFLHLTVILANRSRWADGPTMLLKQFTASDMPTRYIEDVYELVSTMESNALIRKLWTLKFDRLQ